MGALQPNNVYALEEDISGNICAVKFLYFIADIRKNTWAIFDVGHETDRDKSFWGNHVAVSARYDDFPLKDIRVPMVPINLLMLTMLPETNTVLNVSNLHAVGTGRGIMHVPPLPLPPKAH